MSVNQYLEEMNKIQDSLLNYLDNQDNVEENLQNFYNNLEDFNVIGQKDKFISLLHLLSNISMNHRRVPNFNYKIEHILKNFKDNIQNYCSNSELFQIFKESKRILLFLIEEKMMIFNKYIVQKIIKDKYINRKYPQYFAPEIKPFIKKIWFPKPSQDNIWIEDLNKELPDNFYELRRIGENDDFICKLIREDSIKDFIIYLNQNNISPNSTIKSSIYETNNFLNDKENIELIQYATFFGSIQIFQYLQSNQVESTESLFLFAVHGENSEICHYIEKIIDNPPKSTSNSNGKNFKSKNRFNQKTEIFSYKISLDEAIKCHHIDFANYIINNHLNTFDQNSIVSISLKYYNFHFLNGELINENLFLDLIKYGNIQLISIFLKEKNIDVNKAEVKVADKENHFRILDKKEEINSAYEDEDIDVNYIVKEIKSALFIAVKKCHSEIVKLLLSSNNIDVNFPYKFLSYDWSYGEIEKIIKTPLFMAVENADIEIVKLLLMNDKIDINAQYKYDKSIGNMHLHSKTDDNYQLKQEKERVTPLYMAVENVSIEIVKLLLTNDKIDPNIQFLIYYSDEFRTLADTGCGYINIKKEEEPAFYLAIKYGNIEIIKLLVKNDKIDINVPFISNKISNRIEGLDFEDRDDYISEIIKKDWEVSVNCDGGKEINPIDFAFDKGENEIIKEIVLNKNVDYNKILKCDIETYKVIFDKMGYDIVPK